MFTGIVQALCPVVAVERLNDLSRLHIDLGEYAEGLQLGASVAVNGTCLTVTSVADNVTCFDVIVETLRTTNLGTVEQGQAVNIERSFQVGDEVGGHIVSGHVTGTAQLLRREESGHDVVLHLQPEAQWMKFIFHKGFVALDGASLTVSSIDRDAGSFTVSLIPETLARTTLGPLQPGARVNIEVDAQTVTTVETVERVLADEQIRAAMLG